MRVCLDILAMQRGGVQVACHAPDVRGDAGGVQGLEVHAHLHPRQCFRSAVAVLPQTAAS